MNRIFCATLAAAPALAGDFVDTRLSFTVGDDDFLHDAGESTPGSPLTGFGDRPGYEMFFDNLNRRTTGRESLLHLVLWKKVDGFVPRLTTEAAAAVQIDMGEMASDSPEVGRVFKDDTSYLRLAYALASGEGDFTLFPFSTDRFRLGWLYDLTWGGDGIFPGKQGPAPGAKIGVTKERWYAFAGMKTAQVEAYVDSGEGEGGEDIEILRPQMFYAALAGGGVRLLGGGLWIDAGGGWFQMGQIDRTDVRRETAVTAGGSGRAAWVVGLPIGLSADLRLFRTDAAFLESLNRPETYPGGFNWSVALEGDFLVQTLADPDAVGSTKREPAPAGALDARAKWELWRANLTLFYRSLAFLLHETPGDPPFLATTDSEYVEVTPEIFVAAAVDRHFPSLHLTPGLQAGVEFPASKHSVAPPPLVGEATHIFRADGTDELLPEGEEAVPIFAFKASVRWDLSTMMSALVMAFATIDENRSSFVLAANATNRPQDRAFEDAFALGGAAVVQARF